MIFLSCGIFKCHKCAWFHTQIKIKAGIKKGGKKDALPICKPTLSKFLMYSLKGQNPLNLKFLLLKTALGLGSPACCGSCLSTVQPESKRGSAPGSVVSAPQRRLLRSQSVQLSPRARGWSAAEGWRASLAPLLLRDLPWGGLPRCDQMKQLRFGGLIKYPWRQGLDP